MDEELAVPDEEQVYHEVPVPGVGLAGEQGELLGVPVVAVEAAVEVLPPAEPEVVLVQVLVP